MAINDTAEQLRSEYDPALRLQRLRDSVREPIRERTPRRLLHRTHDGALVPTVPVSDEELPEFVKARAR